MTGHLENYRLERFETKTGIRLNPRSERYREGDEDPGLLFDDVEKAKAYARSDVKPGEMLYLYDGHGDIIYENVYDVIYVTRAAGRKWWQFWK